MFRFILIGLSFGMAAIGWAAEPAAGKASSAPAERSYKKFAADEPMQDWRRANDTVRDVGGWRAYVKEAARANRVAPAQAKSSATPAPTEKERK